MRPPCRQVVSNTGRPSDDPLTTLNLSLSAQHSNESVITFVSTCNMSLSKYASTLPEYCSRMHGSSCTVCQALLTVAQTVLDNGFVLLAQAFKSAFPNVTYHSHSAKQRLLQTPLAAICVGTPESGLAEVYLF